MNRWRTLEWNTPEQSDTDKEETFRLCQALCVIATFAKGGFAPYNDEIFSKVVPYMKKIATGTDGYGDISGELVTQHMVAYLDVLSAVFDGQVNHYSQR